MASAVASSPLPEAARRAWNPFRLSGTDLPPNVLLMTKILALWFLVSGHWRALPDHFLPFIAMLGSGFP